MLIRSRRMKNQSKRVMRKKKNKIIIKETKQKKVEERYLST